MRVSKNEGAPLKTTRERESLQTGNLRAEGPARILNALTFCEEIMWSKADSRKKAGGSSGNGKFLSDLDTISKAFYVDKTLPRLASSTASSRSKSVGKFHMPEPKMKPEDAKNYTKDSFDKDKKSSIWSWKGLKALTHVRNRRFNCCFSLLVHSIEGLPAFFDDVCLVVHWKRRDGERMTCPIRVYQGVAKFKEQLTHSCSVYGSRSGPHNSAKYEAKHFLLLLPLTLEELEEEKSSGKWTTSFKLSGKARGATLNKLDEEMSNTSAENKLEADSLSSPIDPRKMDLLTPPDASEKNYGSESEMTEFSVIDRGIEGLNKEHAKPEDESLKIAQGSGDGLEFAFQVARDEEAFLHPSAVEVVPQNHEQSICTCNFKEKGNDMCSKESLMKELRTALSCTTDLVNEGLDSQEDETDALNLENYMEVNSNYRDHRKGKSLSLDDVTESVASDFLEMLGIEHSPFNLSSERLPSFINVEGFKEMSKIETDAFRTKTRASRMEDLETEALMRDWGLNERAFQHSPSSGSGGFGSPIDIPPEDPLQLPPLAEGLGPFVQTKNGGFLRSMNPALFRNAKSAGA
ncbi:hypothetical protein Pfo_028395 [Paulownia fortunei]|nr:hypothetical protein Pfo_028395 [Paulownia fortunei]